MVNLKRLALLVLLGVLIGLTTFWMPGRFTGASDEDDASAEPSASSSQASAPASGAGSGPSKQSTADPEPASEALPEAASTPTESGLPGLGKRSRTTSAALVSEPLPKSAVRKDRLVAGYPGALAPPGRTTVRISSVSAAKGVLQVALTATCRRPCGVLRHFRVGLARHGFEEVGTVSVENAPAAALHRGKDTVNVTVTRTSRRSVDYSLFAVLHTKT